VKAIGLLDARDGRGAGAEDAHAFGRCCSKPLAERGPACGFFHARGLDEEIGQHAEGRVVHPAAVLQLALDEAA
jgi:hypothetical protein